MKQAITGASGPLTEEQRSHAVRGHYYEFAGMDGERGEIWCYTDRYAYSAGERVTLFVSATASAYGLEIVRDGATETGMLKMDGLACHWQETPECSSVEGCGWKPSFAFGIPPSWPSGAYRITLRAAGHGGHTIHCHHLFIVRPSGTGRTGRSTGRILQVAATGTWTAYNTWGGSNSYEGILGPDRRQFATTVSTQRPFGRGFFCLPPDAPRVPLDGTPPPAAIPSYPHMEWALANGYSKKYASAGWASYDSHFFRWAERAGYLIDLISQHELHFDPDILTAYDCVSFVGHDEYWTWEMRDAVDNYVEQGGHVARFAGNFMWQTRLEDEGRKQVCYKYRARAEDPHYQGADQSRTTTAWEAPETGRPGASTFGLNATDGLYAGWGGCAPRGVRGFPLYRPEHWAFDGTGLYYGDLLGADGHVYGYEVDGLDYVIRGGLAYPSPTSGAPAGLEILALGMASQVEESRDIPAQGQFLKDDDARFIAEMKFGTASAENVDRVKRGAGMIVNFPKGRGEVFHAGSCEWVAGLLHRDPLVEKVTRNVIDRYLSRT